MAEKFESQHDTLAAGTIYVKNVSTRFMSKSMFEIYILFCWQPHNIPIHKNTWNPCVSLHGASPNKLWMLPTCIDTTESTHSVTHTFSWTSAVVIILAGVLTFAASTLNFSWSTSRTRLILTIDWKMKQTITSYQKQQLENKRWDVLFCPPSIVS